MTILFTNNASTSLASSITSSATSLTVVTGTGSLFPTISGSNIFYLTLQNQSNTTPIEIVKVTARFGDTMTIVRGQDGTTASAFNAGDKVELRLPAVVLQDFPQLDVTNTFTVDQSISGLTVGQGTNPGFNNTALGTSVLASSNSSSYNNTGVGYQAMTALTSANSNTATGFQALGQTTSGNSNSGFGDQALYANTTGASNTALGAFSLAANTTANNNVAVGYQAAYSNTTGAGNTAVGTYALQNNTTAGTNTAIGNAALNANTTGANNAALGFQALQANTTASNNTAVGYQAGYSNTTGTAQVLIGNVAGYSITTGNSNVCIGGGAGYSLTTGTGNTFVGGGYTGSYAASGNAMTTGNGNSIFGNFNGNQGGLDIRTSNGYIVLSDGYGNPRAFSDNNGSWFFQCTALPTNGVGGILLSSPATSNGMILGTTGTGATNMIRFYNPNGNVGAITTSGSLTTYAVSSDYRLKENIAPMTGALDIVSKLKPCTYTWKADGSDGQGFIAHELAEVVPDCVTGKKDAVDADGKPVYQGIDTSFLVATLTAAIQELSAEVTALKAKLGA